MLSILFKFISFINLKTTAAKASFTSIRSMSEIFIFALSKAFFVAGAGPVNIIVGSVEHVAIERMIARGLRFSFFPIALDPIIAREAPSTIPDEFPAVWTWLIFSIIGYFSLANESKPN